jgi:cysteine desulfurase / selenocysteine lyase
MDWNKIREEFLIVQAKYPVLTGDGIKNTPVAYLDNAASSPMPSFLQKKFCEIFNNYYSNVHRGSHFFSQVSSEKFDEARNIVAGFIGGDRKKHEIIFTYNTTDSLNLASHLIKEEKGIILVSEAEHHSNYLPYIKNNKIKLFNVTPPGDISYDDLENKLKKYNVKLVAVTGVSNVTGIITDINRASKLAHKYGAKILVDGAQMLAHLPVNVKRDKIDFLVGAGHKMYAPGVAFLYGPRSVLDKAEPYRPGGGTIDYVTEGGVGYAKSPERHEGGTPNIAGAVILGEIMEWLRGIGMSNIYNHEISLLKYLLKGIKKIPQVKIYGGMDIGKNVGLISFNIEGVHHSLAAAILNYEGGVATRNGCHCAHIYLKRLLGLNKKDIEKIKKILLKKRKGITEAENLIIPGTLRASLGVFNNKEDVDKLIKGVKMIAERKWRGKYEYKSGAYKLRIK